MRAVLVALVVVALAGCDVPQSESSAEVAVELPAANTVPSAAQSETAVAALSAPAAASVEVK